MATTTAPLYLATVIIFGYAYQYIRTKKLREILTAQILFPFITVGIVALCFFGARAEKAFHLPTPDIRAQISSYRQILSRPDEQWIDERTDQVRRYITKHSSKSDYIFAFTSNPIYYYLTNRKNPSRFYISWYADPQPLTDELLNDLKKNPPKLIIYKEATWMDYPDNQTMQHRLPEVHQWMKENYKKSTTISNTEILEKS